MRHKCPNCSSHNGYEIYKDGSYCHKCKLKNPNKSLLGLKEHKTVDLELPPIEANILTAEIKWLKKYYFTNSMIMKYGFFHSRLYNRLIYPIYDQHQHYVAAIGRDISGHVKPKSIHIGIKQAFLIGLRQGRHDLCIVEDTLSAIRVYEATGTPVLCLGGTSISKRDKRQVLLSILMCDRLIIWMDGDEPGQTAAKRIKDKYKLIRPCINIKTEKDPKEYSDDDILATICRTTTSL